MCIRDRNKSTRILNWADNERDRRQSQSKKGERAYKRDAQAIVDRSFAKKFLSDALQA